MNLSPESRKLILDFEVGGGEAYYTKYLSRPTWPGAASGVTVGIGYDCGYNSRAAILADWSDLGESGELAKTAGIKGVAAKSAVAGVKNLRIPWALALQVYEATTVPKFWRLCQRTWPGFDALHPNCQGALLSLTFNRGSAMDGDRRREMRAIRDLTKMQDYRGIAWQLRAMKRIWRGKDIEQGMNRRRDAEAKLVETCL
jgi:hypothetical protein